MNFYDGWLVGWLHFKVGMGNGFPYRHGTTYFRRCEGDRGIDFAAKKKKSSGKGGQKSNVLRLVSDIFDRLDADLIPHRKHERKILRRVCFSTITSLWRMLYDISKVTQSQVFYSSYDCRPKELSLQAMLEWRK